MNSGAVVGRSSIFTRRRFRRGSGRSRRRGGRGDDRLRSRAHCASCKPAAAAAADLTRARSSSARPASVLAGGGVVVSSRRPSLHRRSRSLAPPLRACSSCGTQPSGSPSPLVSLGQQPVPVAPRLAVVPSLSSPAALFPVAGDDHPPCRRRPGRRCRGPCAADTRNGHAGRRWDDRAAAPCSCGTARTRLRTRAAMPADLPGTRDGCRTHTPRRRRRRPA